MQVDDIKGINKNKITKNYLYNLLSENTFSGLYENNPIYYDPNFGKDSI